MVEATELVQQPPPSSDQNVLYLIYLSEICNEPVWQLLSLYRKKAIVHHS